MFRTHSISMGQPEISLSDLMNDTNSKPTRTTSWSQTANREQSIPLPSKLPLQSLESDLSDEHALLPSGDIDSILSLTMPQPPYLSAIQALGEEKFPSFLVGNGVDCVTPNMNASQAHLSSSPSLDTTIDTADALPSPAATSSDSPIQPSTDSSTDVSSSSTYDETNDLSQPFAHLIGVQYARQYMKALANEFHAPPENPSNKMRECFISPSEFHSTKPRSQELSHKQTEKNPFYLDHRPPERKDVVVTLPRICTFEYDGVVYFCMLLYVDQNFRVKNIGKDVQRPRSGIDTFGLEVHAHAFYIFLPEMLKPGQSRQDLVNPNGLGKVYASASSFAQAVKRGDSAPRLTFQVFQDLGIANGAFWRNLKHTKSVPRYHSKTNPVSVKKSKPAANESGTESKDPPKRFSNQENKQNYCIPASHERFGYIEDLFAARVKFVNLLTLHERNVLVSFIQQQYRLDRPELFKHADEPRQKKQKNIDVEDFIRDLVETHTKACSLVLSTSQDDVERTGNSNSEEKSSSSIPEKKNRSESEDVADEKSSSSKSGEKSTKEKPPTSSETKKKSTKEKPPTSSETLSSKHETKKKLSTSSEAKKRSAKEKPSTSSETGQELATKHETKKKLIDNEEHKDNVSDKASKKASKSPRSTSDTQEKPSRKRKTADQTPNLLRVRFLDENGVYFV